MIEVLHTRDPDAACTVLVFVDGKEVEVDMEDIDPGRGWTREDWNEHIEFARANVTRSPAFHQLAIDELEAWSDNEFIDGDR